jgi:predicted enzyme related to lactoylglutathione lyase
VPDAAALKDFYAGVAGWRFSEHDMGEYSDYNVMDSQGQTVAGLCHARGSNAAAPPQWLIYVQVDDVQASTARATELGGTILDGPRSMGKWQFAVVRDPAGAVFGLIGG